MLYILMESKPAEVLLNKLLQEERQAGSVNLQSFREPSSLYGGARALLVMRHKAVAVVLRRRLDLSGGVGPAATVRRGSHRGGRLGGTTKNPGRRAEHGSLLFRRPNAVARAYGPVSESLLELGQISPATPWRNWIQTWPATKPRSRLSRSWTPPTLRLCEMNRPCESCWSFSAS